jgi:hypothetical protein
MPSTARTRAARAPAQPLPPPRLPLHPLDTPPAENDAKAGIDRAVSGDSFGATYAATENGYRDADAAIYPEDNAGQFWLNPGNYRRMH